MKTKSKKKIRIIICAGARPNLMKVSPLIEAIRKHNRGPKNKSAPLIDYCFVYTGQHYDKKMSGIFWRELGLPRPDFDLKVGSASHAAQTAAIMKGFETICRKVKPDIVLVAGDVNSTLACALVAVKMGIKTAHVEAGLRSFDKTMPEEINRMLTDRISDFLFATEESAVKNLKNEGIKKETIHFVGNVMIDTLLRLKGNAARSDIRSQLGMNKEDMEYALLTLHRPSNVDNSLSLKNLLNTLSDLTRQITIIFPAHPRTLKMLSKFHLNGYVRHINPRRKQKIQKNRINCIEPLGYTDFINLVSGARFVLTDSGGIQEETAILGIPCLTIRKNTERPATLEKGTNVLVGCSKARIMKEAKKIINSGPRPKNRHSLKFWDGKAAERIIKIIAGSKTKD